MRTSRSLPRLLTFSGCAAVLACSGATDADLPADSSGGASTGGSTTATGSTSGAPSTGGSSTGGSSTGGSSSGGVSTGGSSSGGVSSGGTTSGQTGGVTSGQTGGVSSGGSTTAAGGRASGGVASGGASAGRSAGGMTNTSGGSSALGGRGGATNSGGSAGTSTGSGGSSSGCSATGFHVQGGMLYDVKCNEFVMRGINYPYAWFTSRNAQQDLTAIAATGANTVRLTLATGARWTKTSAANLTSLITAAKAAKLVTVVEVHDTTGYSEQSGSVALSNATSYWTASDIAAALKGQEAYVILNVANEPNGNNTSTNWASTHVTAVGALRSAGFNHTLMIDGPNWGQDWQFTMRDGGGASIWNADTKKNMVFSVHMYDVFETSAIVSNYFNTFLMKYEAPLVVGEFASDHGSAGNVDEASIMSFAESLGIGYLGWSWAGNSSDLGTLNITNNFNASSLTAWGTRLISGENGIKATSKRCTCFD